MRLSPPRSQPSAIAVFAALPLIGRTSALRQTEEIEDLALRLPLDLVDVACPLVVAVDLAFLVRVTLGVPRHEIRVLDVADGAALRVFAGDQVDRLAPPPGFLPANQIFDVADVDRHGAPPLGGF